MRGLPVLPLLALALCLSPSNAFTTLPSCTFLRPSNPPPRAFRPRGTALFALSASSGSFKADDDSVEGPVSSMEILAKFREMDGNSNGQLSPNEIIDVLKDLEYTEEEADCIYQQMDLNGDGEVSEDEFVAACQSSGVCAIEDDASDMEGLFVEGRSAQDEELLKGAFAKMQIWVRSQPSDLCTGKVVEVQSEEDFDRLIAKAGDVPVCVMWAATYCRKCMALKPKFSRIAQGYEKRAVFLKCYLDKVGMKLVKERAGIVAVPTFQMWKQGEIVGKFVAGPGLTEVVKGIVDMTDKHLDCGFSLMKKIDDNVEDSKAEMVGSSPPPKEKVEITLGKAEVSMDAMAAWRAAQANKQSRRRL